MNRIASINDAEIADALVDLCQQNENGEVGCLAIAVIHADGSATTMIYGSVNMITLVGALEILKAGAMRNGAECEPPSGRRLV